MSLIDGQDFFDELEPTSALPGGSVVEIEVLNRDRTVRLGLWAFTFSTPKWVIRIDAADHANIVAGSWFRFWVTYPSNGGRICWLAGPVERNRR
jgi:hypothetical protein